MPTPDDSAFPGQGSPRVGKPTWGDLAHCRLGVPKWAMVSLTVVGGLIAVPFLLLGVGLFILMVGMNDTVYSKGYSERSFKSLRVGMTIEQVEATIGPPLHRYSYSSPGFFGYSPGEERWVYSESRSDNGTYYKREIDFKNGRISGVHASFFYE